ncbi:MAG: HD-like signal output (HDOD) protein [Planctomycetota bacterium]|jgi:HD-like signal output (HDOD) protein
MDNYLGYSPKPSTPAALVENVLQLVSLPEVYLRLQAVIEDPLHSRKQVAELIGYDPGLSARLLRIANSAYYSFPGEIDSISTAVNIIGEMELRNITLAISVADAVSQLGQPGIDIDAFWLHSIKCALIARLSAKQVGNAYADSLFLAGMLHDLGQLVLYRNEPELARAVAWHQREYNISRHLAEQALLGFDHSVLGGLLARSWGLPETLCDLIMHHHTPELVEANRPLADIIVLANHLAQPECDVASELADSPSSIFPLLKRVGITGSDVTLVAEKAVQQCDEVLSLICG